MVSLKQVGIVGIVDTVDIVGKVNLGWLNFVETDCICKPNVNIESRNNKFFQF